MILVFASMSCDVSDQCYNRYLEKNHSGICQDDCPGVCGCDGQVYCNECYANQKGIKVVDSFLCD